MSTSSLLETMTREVEHKCARILDSAREEEACLLAAAREGVVRRRDKAVRAAETELAKMAQHARERAEAEAEMVVLTTKDTITDEILASVAEKLGRIVPTPEFPAILEALLAEALLDAPGAEVVLAPTAHVDHCRDWLAANGHGKLEVQGRDSLVDGIALQDRACRFRVTNTLSARLVNQEGRLRKLCITRLLPGDSVPDDGTRE